MRLELYTDGSAEDRVERPGGWAFVIVRGDEVLATRSGGAPKTTSLVMELEAARAALCEVVARGLHVGHEVVLLTDSSIAVEVASGRYLPKPARYAQLCASLRQAAVEAAASAQWVKGHAGHRWNEHVDALARQARLAEQVAIVTRKQARRRRP
jgi:ribonuclease HI